MSATRRPVAKNLSMSGFSKSREVSTKKTALMRALSSQYARIRPVIEERRDGASRRRPRRLGDEYESKIDWLFMMGGRGETRHRVLRGAVVRLTGI
jgi:hypothetical protein